MNEQQKVRRNGFLSIWVLSSCNWNVLENHLISSRTTDYNILRRRSFLCAWKLYGSEQWQIESNLITSFHSSSFLLFDIFCLSFVVIGQHSYQRCLFGSFSFNFLPLFFLMPKYCCLASCIIYLRKEKKMSCTMYMSTNCSNEVKFDDFQTEKREKIHEVVNTVQWSKSNGSRFYFSDINFYLENVVHNAVVRNRFSLCFFHSVFSSVSLADFSHHSQCLLAIFTVAVDVFCLRQALSEVISCLLEKQKVTQYALASLNYAQSEHK